MKKRLPRRPRLQLVLLLMLLAGLIMPIGSQAQQGILTIDPHDYSVRAVRIPGAVALDGVLDEPAWGRAQPATDFTQRNPDEGAPASERTEIRILFNGSTLFIGARMYDQHPQNLVVSQMRRDSRLMGDDYLDIVIDTFHDHRNAFQFQINPAGARYDAYITDEGRDVNGDFNVVWDAATVVDAEGWTAEIAIPFSQLRFPNRGDEHLWGINFYRNIRHKNEEDYWVPTPRDFGYRAITRMSNAGLLQGLEGIHSGRNIQVKPYGLGGTGLTRVRAPDPGEPARETDSLTDLGVDLKVGVTASMTLDLTFNTDFAQ
ncbi:carbohydrate binding family 9 domain-containing protein, partial [Gemmatimonadota bacterium]